MSQGKYVTECECVDNVAPTCSWSVNVVVGSVEHFFTEESSVSLSDSQEIIGKRWIGPKSSIVPSTF